MAMIVPKAVLEEIRLKSDVVAVVGSYIPLQRSGSAFKALCPFHKEKTPSFTVNPQRQIYHCFGCGAGGDVFRFIMDYEKLDFPSAVKLLADKAGVRLAWEEDGGSDRAEREALYALNNGAADLYYRILVKTPDGAAARRYLASRDLPAFLRRLAARQPGARSP